MMARKRSLETKDLGETPEDVKASFLHNSFKTAWKKECEKLPEERSLFRTLMRIVGWGKANCVVTIYTLSSLIKLVPSLLLSALIDDFETDSLGRILHIVLNLGTTMRWCYALGLFLIPVICWLMWMYAESQSIRMGGKIRAMVSDAIYRKAFTLSSVSRCSTSSGELMNLMSSDAYLVNSLWNLDSSCFGRSFSTWH